MQEEDPLIAEDEEPAGSSSEPVCSRSFACGIASSLACTLAGGAVVYARRGGEGLALFAASYAMELSLSMDNMFAFYLIFKWYRCPVEAQATCLFWGVAGAVVLRAAILLLGTAVVSAAQPLMLLFAAVLVYSAVGMMGAQDDDDDDVSSNRVVRCVQRLRLPVTSQFHGHRFVVFEHGALRATPLALVLLTIELSDIVFAVDSVPAVLGLTSDPLIAYVAVMCAVIGLRSIYTLTVLLIRAFRFLQYAVALLLLFVGSKIAIEVLLGIRMPPRAVLAVIVSTLGGAMIFSCIAARWGKPVSKPATAALP